LTTGASPTACWTGPASQSAFVRLARSDTSICSRFVRYRPTADCCMHERAAAPPSLDPTLETAPSIGRGSLGRKCRSAWMQQRPLRGARRLRICRRSNDATMHSPRSPSRVNAFVSTSATALLISEKTSYPAQADSSPERYPNRTIWAAPHLRAARPLWSESGRRGGVSDLGGGEQPTPEASAASTSGSALSQDAECRLCARRLRDARWNKTDEGHPRPQARVCVWRPSLRPGDVPRSG